MLKAPRSLSSPTSSASLLTQTVKNLSAMQETQVQFLGQEDLLQKEWQPTPVFFMVREAWHDTVMGSQESDTT